MRMGSGSPSAHGVVRRAGWAATNDVSFMSSGSVTSSRSAASRSLPVALSMTRPSTSSPSEQLHAADAGPLGGAPQSKLLVRTTRTSRRPLARVLASWSRPGMAVSLVSLLPTAASARQKAVTAHLASAIKRAVVRPASGITPA